jgi:tRNA threonylcarbamoyladenosine biosynthesis protein TsaB
LSLFLNIDTATERASVCLSDDKKILAIEISFDQKNHASFIQPAVKKLFESTGQQLSNLDAVAVTAGPGSYTGLRVGLATAKGLCYALSKPLILLNTLEVMAQASINELKHSTLNFQHPTFNIQPLKLYCSMIDARRMEVFTAIYDDKLQMILYPSAVILSENIFNEYLNKHPVIFSGSGSLKFRNILRHPNAIFSDVKHSAEDMLALTVEAFTQQQFADIAYSEPFYLKEFFTPSQSVIDKKF